MYYVKYTYELLRLYYKLNDNLRTQSVYDEFSIKFQRENILQTNE